MYKRYKFSLQLTKFRKLINFQATTIYQLMNNLNIKLLENSINLFLQSAVWYTDPNVRLVLKRRWAAFETFQLWISHFFKNQFLQTGNVLRKTKEGAMHCWCTSYTVPQFEYLSREGSQKKYFATLKEKSRHITTYRSLAFFLKQLHPNFRGKFWKWRMLVFSNTANL